MSVKIKPFGLLNGNEIMQYSISNRNGMIVKILNIGAIISSIKVPINNNLIEIACGFDTIEGYLSEAYTTNSPYFGCTVGRYCSQIKDAKFTLNGREYKLNANAGNNNLHGGNKGFDKKIWSAEIIGDVLEMNLLSNDMEEGFPGNVEIKVSFQLTDENEIKINYYATSDKETPFSVTNHTYFNLTGFSENVENHIAQVNTQKRLVLDESGAATGEIVNVAGKVDDMTVGKRIGDVHEAMGDGFEHFYVFDNPTSTINHVASIYNSKSEIMLEVQTTEPCMLLYTGKYTSDELCRESGDKFGKFRAFCCETHRYPNGPNIENSPGTYLKPGEEFTSTTVYRFSRIVV